MVVGGAGIDPDARQQRRNLDIPEVVRLAHDNLAAEVTFALFKQYAQHGSDRVGIGVERFLRVSLAVILRHELSCSP